MRQSGSAIGKLVTKIESWWAFGSLVAGTGVLTWLGRQWELIASQGWAATILIALLGSAVLAIAVSLVVLAVVHVRRPKIPRESLPKNAAASATAAPSKPQPESKLDPSERESWPKTSDYDLPIKLRVIDELLAIVGSEKECENAARAGSRFLREWKNEIAQGKITKLLEDLKDYMEKCSTLQRKIEKIRKDNEKYEDIHEILDFGNSKNVIMALNLLMAILDALGPTPPTKFAYFVEPAAKDLSVGLKEFGSWRFQTERALLARRKELST